MRTYLSAAARLVRDARLVRAARLVRDARLVRTYNSRLQDLTVAARQVNKT